MSDYIVGGEETGSARASSPAPDSRDGLARNKYNDLLVKGEEGDLSAADRSWMNRFDRDQNMQISDATKDELKGFISAYKELPAALEMLLAKPTIQEQFRSDQAREFMDNFREDRRRERTAKRDVRRSRDPLLMRMLDGILGDGGSAVDDGIVRAEAVGDK